MADTLNTVIVSEQNYNVVVDEQNNLTIEIAQASLGPIGFTGSQGFTGSAGYVGSQGSIGYTGSQGDTGYVGSQGLTGFTGSVGAQGATGFTGSVGYTGSIGASGYTGSAGYVGSQGVKGDTGYTGSAGAMGLTGYTGSVGAQGLTGYVGSQGIQGNIGYTGSQGIQGVAGYVGSQGAVGFTGSLGYTGSQGAAGFTGSQGAQGDAGYTGSTGYTGSVGFTGSVGYVGSQGPIGYTGSAPEVFDHITLNNTTGFVGTAAGQMWWDGEGTVNIQMLNGVTQQVGEETYFYGKASGNIANGDVVMFAGAEGDHALFAKADVNAVGFQPRYVIGLSTQDITNGTFGYVTNFGKVHQLNTAAWAPGTSLYLDPAVVGGLTSTAPVTPKIVVAAVLRQHANEGVLLVRPDFGYYLQDLHNVAIATPAVGQVFGYNGSQWVNANAVDDSSNTSTTVGWSANKIFTEIGYIGSALDAIIG